MRSRTNSRKRASPRSSSRSNRFSTVWRRSGRSWPAFANPQHISGRQELMSEGGVSARHVGVVGLAVMGENLALNIARNGFPIAVYNRDTTKVDRFLGRAHQDLGNQDVIGTY